MPVLAAEILRPALLDGVAILLAHAPASASQPAGFAAAVERSCAGLGAVVSALDVASAAARDPTQETIEAPRRTSAPADATIEPARQTPERAQEAVERAVELALAGALDMLVVDSAGLFAAGAGSGAAGALARNALLSCMQDSWNVTRAVVNAAFLGGGRAGRVVYIAPRAHAGEHADAARAGLENLARTLSVEWARHGVTVVAVAPGVRTLAEEVAALVAYLASPAGAYFSGCQLDLRGPRGLGAPA